jgi:glycosyltransferase involved in cell wall biosynthesis
MRAIHLEHNSGPYTTRNIGMQIARGQYIAFTDGDDWAESRMCEVMYRRAMEDDADVLIANASIFYDDTKIVDKLFDSHIRSSLNPRLKMGPFDLATEPRILLLYANVWLKLCKRAFLTMHEIQFDDGKSSYDDLCFHFTVLLKAKRISLIDDSLYFYRLNRLDQIMGKSSQRVVFEGFGIFSKIQENLSNWDVSDDIWGIFVAIQLRLFRGLYLDGKIKTSYKHEFFRLVAKQLEAIPKRGLRTFSQFATPDELSILLCMRRNWIHAYELVENHREPLFSTFYMIHDRRPGFLMRDFRRMITLFRSFLKKVLNLIVHD